MPLDPGPNGSSSVSQSGSTGNTAQSPSLKPPPWQKAKPKFSLKKKTTKWWTLIKKKRLVICIYKFVVRFCDFNFDAKLIEKNWFMLCMELSTKFGKDTFIFIEMAEIWIWENLVLFHENAKIK